MIVEVQEIGSTNVSVLVTPDPAPIVIVQTVGLQGPPGEGVSYTHTQSVPSATWTINHNLGYNPIVSVFSDGGLIVEAEALNISVNQLQISFNAAFSGTARLI